MATRRANRRGGRASLRRRLPPRRCAAVRLENTVRRANGGGIVSVAHGDGVAAGVGARTAGVEIVGVCCGQWHVGDTV